MRTDVPLLADERVDDLMIEQLKIIQSPQVFRFSMDAVMLARFTWVPLKGRIIDLCSGNGVIPLLLSTRTQAPIVAVEIQQRLAEMAQRSIQMNELEQQIYMHHLDLKEAIRAFGVGGFDLVTVNPPYMPLTMGQISENEHVAYARHEVGCTLDDVLRVSSQLLRVGGKFSMVYRATRLVDALIGMRQYRLEPKRIQWVHARRDMEPQMVLIEGIRDGKSELRTLPPWIIDEQTEGWMYDAGTAQF